MRMADRNNARVRAVARRKGSPPGQWGVSKISEFRIRKMVELWEETHNMSAVARAMGVHMNTVRKYVNAYREKQEVERARNVKTLLPVDPIPYADLTDEARATLESTPEGFALFCRTFLEGDRGPLEFDPWAAELAVELLNAYLSDEDEWLLVNVAYNAGKSTVITYAFVVWLVVRERTLGREPTVFLGHRAEARAKWYLTRIKREFELNRRLLDAFGRLRPERRYPRWSTTEIEVEPLKGVLHREKEPTIAIGSYEGAVMSGHYKFVVWDDLVDEKNSRKGAERDRLAAWFDQTAESRVREGGTMVFSNCRFGPRDLSYTLRSQRFEDDLDEHGEPKKMWRPIVYKAHYPDRCRGEHGKDAPAYPEGCLLSPFRVRWERLRRKMKDDKKFRLNYQQEDVDASGALADEAWFTGGTDQQGMLVTGCFVRDLHFGQFRRDQSNELRPIQSVVSIDPSGTAYWGVLHVVTWSDGKRQVYRAKREPMQAPELIYRAEDGAYSGLLEDWRVLAEKEQIPIRYAIVETRGVQRWLEQWEFITTWFQRHGIVLLPHDTNRVNKHDPDRGVEMLGPMYREARWLIPYSNPEERYIGDTLKAEATTYPEGDTSDLLMASWFHEHHADTLIGLEEDEDEEETDAPAWGQVDTPWWGQQGGESEILTRDPFGRRRKTRESATA
jgi:hypothetical protein